MQMLCICIKHVMKKPVVFILIAICMVFAGCSGQLSDGRLKVCVTVYPLYDFAKKIGGDKVNIIDLSPSGDIHDFEPSNYDVAQIVTGDMFLYNGAGLEHWVESVIQMIDGAKTDIAEASQGIELLELDGHGGEEHSHAYDPHIWLNPLNAKIIACNIKEALCRADSENSAYYRENYRQLEAEFDILDGEYTSRLQNLALDTIAVTHNAFGYLCKAYNLRQIALSNTEGDHGYSGADLNELKMQISQKNIKVIFYNQADGTAYAQSLVELTDGTEIKMLSTLSSLTQRQKNSGGDYFSVMRENLAALIYALT
jgi:zinc transport system substrate-binding protein